MRYYIVTHDRQGGEFGMYRAYTAQEWSEQAQEWCDSDDDEVLESWDLSNYDCEEALICDIDEWWEITLKEITEEQKKKYEELLEKIDIVETKCGRFFESGERELYKICHKERDSYYDELDKLYEEAREVTYCPPRAKRELDTLTGFVLSIKGDRLDIAETGLGKAYTSYTYKGSKESIKDCVSKFLEDYFKEG